MLVITTVWAPMVVRSHSDLEPYKNLLQFQWRENGLQQVQRVEESSEHNTRVIKQNHNDYK